jgi:hypothetical protein
MMFMGAHGAAVTVAHGVIRRLEDGMGSSTYEPGGLAIAAFGIFGDA